MPAPNWKLGICATRAALVRNFVIVLLKTATEFPTVLAALKVNKNVELSFRQVMIVLFLRSWSMTALCTSSLRK
jgi:hypothetical protein